MKNRVWLDNAFWETPEKQILNAICEYQDEKGREVRKVMKMKKTNDDGTLNEDFQECVEFLGTEKIDESTTERRRKKLAEAEANKQKKIDEQQARKLEKLFEYKLETFEISKIKESKNRFLKSKLRRAESIPEVNLYAMMIMQEALTNETSD